jgi:hypothetical protein
MDSNQMNATGDGQSRNSIKEGMSAFAETAKDKLASVAEPVKEKAVELAAEEKDVGANQMKIAARAVHGAASSLESEMPQIAGYIHDAGQRLEQMADQLRQGNVDELMGKLGDYARNQPAMIFGGAMLAGFALTRFVKCAPTAAQPMETQSQPSQPWTGPSSYSGPGGTA